jgi:3'-5' exonuclease
MFRVFLDIETLPPERGDPLLRDRITQLTEEEYRQLALDSRYGRLLCVGVIIEENNLITRRGVLGRDRDTGKFHLDEAKTLRAFWKLTADFKPHRDLLVGFNLLDFDLDFLCTRSVVLKVKPSFNVCFARFRSSPVFDVMWEFTHWRKRISLNEVAKILGLESSKGDEVNGAKVYDLFLAGRHEEIASYCMRDVELTRAVYHRLNFIDVSTGGELENDPVR